MSRDNDIKRLAYATSETQQILLQQLTNITDVLKHLKDEQTSNVNNLRDELRRVEDRMGKRMVELQEAHSKESNKLHEIIQILLKKENSPPAPAAAPVPQFPYNIPPEILQRMMAAGPIPGLPYSGMPGIPQFQGGMPRQQPQVPVQPQLPKIPLGIATVPTPVVSVPAATSEVTTPPTPVKSIVPPAVVKPTPPVEDKAPVVVKPEVPVPKVLPSVAATVPSEKATVATTPLSKPIFSFGPSSGTTPSTINFGNVFNNTKSPAKEEKTAETEEDDHNEEYEPTVDFKPVIPLPDLVKVVTGEEDETELFSERCKMFRYSNDTSEWKERGVGVVRILKSKDGNKYRLVMRREQVLKVCANHPIVNGMTLTLMPKSPKAVSWHCDDFSDDEKQHVMLSARFASVEIRDDFVKIFETAIKNSSAGSEISIEKEEKAAPTSPAVPAASKAEVVILSNFGDKFKPKPGSWECTSCYTRNEEKDEVCPCCSTKKDGSQGDKAESVFNKPSIFPKQTEGAQKYSFGLGGNSNTKNENEKFTGTPKFSFGMSAAAAALEPPKVTSSPGFGGSVNTSGNSLFGTPKSNIFGGGVKSEGTPGTSPSQFTFNKPATAQSFSFTNAAKTTPAAPSSPAVNFSFKTGTTVTPGAATTTSSPAPRQLFGNSAAPPNSVDTTDSAAKSDETATVKPLFESKSGGFSFAALAKKEGNIFEGDAAKKAQDELKSLKKSTAIGTPKEEKENSDENKDKEDEDYEPNVEFKPVVPLPDLIDVVSGEEDETVVFKSRSKVYRFLKDKKENVERGVGDVKILHNSKLGYYRVLMRREQVHKVCANFRVVKGLTINKNTKNTTAVLVSCVDFSENEVEGQQETLTFRFKEEATVDEFVTKINEIIAKL